jgi:hypothetical protein
MSSFFQEVEEFSCLSLPCLWCDLQSLHKLPTYKPCVIFQCNVVKQRWKMRKRRAFNLTHFWGIDSSYDLLNAAQSYLFFAQNHHVWSYTLLIPHLPHRIFGTRNLLNPCWSSRLRPISGIWHADFHGAHCLAFAPKFVLVIALC